eukprot:9481581-Pyramimonas_sp.AAC.1
MCEEKAGPPLSGGWAVGRNPGRQRAVWMGSRGETLVILFGGRAAAHLLTWRPRSRQCGAGGPIRRLRGGAAGTAGGSGRDADAPAAAAG